MTGLSSPSVWTTKQGSEPLCSVNVAEFFLTSWATVIVSGLDHVQAGHDVLLPVRKCLWSHR